MFRRFAVVTALLALCGCKSIEVTQFPRTDAGSDTGADAAADTSADADPADAADPQWAGLPCETNQDCGPQRTCINRAYLDTLGVNPDIDLPGGMCSKLLCFEDEDCGPNGTCFDAGSLGAPGIRICLAACEELVDCRWETGWDCFPLSEVEEGREGGACISDSLQVAIVCDDGHCDDGAAEGSGE